MRSIESSGKVGDVALWNFPISLDWLGIFYSKFNIEHTFVSPLFTFCLLFNTSQVSDSSHFRAKTWWTKCAKFTSTKSTTKW